MTATTTFPLELAKRLIKSPRHQLPDKMQAAAIEEIERLLTVIDRHLTPSEAGWRDIKTIPTDGRPVLAAIEVRKNDEPIHWEIYVIGFDGQYDEMNSDYETGWDVSDYEFWMPLPAAPGSTPPATVNSDAGLVEEQCANCHGMIGDLPQGRDPEELCDTCYMDSQAAAIPTPAVNAELVEAAQELEARAYTSYRARNGRMCSIEGDDGEQAFIVPYDAMMALRAALSRAKGEGA